MSVQVKQSQFIGVFVGLFLLKTLPVTVPMVSEGETRTATYSLIY